MTKPFYTMPEPAARWREADEILSAHRRRDEAVVETPKCLSRFAKASADDVQTDGGV